MKDIETDIDRLKDLGNAALDRGDVRGALIIAIDVLNLEAYAKQLATPETHGATAER